jgi:serine/threonine protein kinase
MNFEKEIIRIHKLITAHQSAFLDTLRKIIHEFERSPEVSQFKGERPLKNDEVNYKEALASEKNYNTRSFMVNLSGVSHKQASQEEIIGGNFSFQVVRAQQYAERNQFHYFLVLPIQLGSGANGSVNIAWHIKCRHIFYWNAPQPHIELDVKHPFKMKKVSFPPTPETMQQYHMFPPNYAVMELLNPGKVFHTRFDTPDTLTAPALDVSSSQKSSKDEQLPDITEIFFLPIREGTPLSELVSRQSTSIQPNLNWDENKFLDLMLKMTYLIFLLHLDNICIRDIKPDNFLFKESSDKFIKVALIDEDSTRNPGTAGSYDHASFTSVYAAPEFSQAKIRSLTNHSSTKEFYEYPYRQADEIPHPPQSEMEWWTTLRQNHPELKNFATDFFAKVKAVKENKQAKADIYSLGTTFIALLFGEQFFISAEQESKKTGITFQPGNMLTIEDTLLLTKFVEFKQQYVAKNLPEVGKWGSIKTIIVNMLAEHPKERLCSADLLLAIAETLYGDLNSPSVESVNLYPLGNLCFKNLSTIEDKELKIC